MQKQRFVGTSLVNAVPVVALLAVLLACPLSCRAEGGDPYSQDVQRMTDNMTTLDCARCHYEIFMTIRNGQGAHRIKCRECHTTFHSFQKGLRYEDVLPKCTDCHDTPHGTDAKMTACKNCHVVPHAPKASLELKTLQPYCADCHTDAGTRMARDLTAHSRLKCVFCHAERHGTIPTCRACHGTPHPAEMTAGFSGCLDCHGNPHDLSLAVDESTAGPQE
jgi:hypothetical protein